MPEATPGQNTIVAIVHNPLRMFKCDMVGCQWVICFLGYPEGVKPGMKLHVSFVAFVDPELKRIVKRRR